MAVIDPFPPLRGTIAYAESWNAYLNTFQDELRTQPARDVIAKAENVVGIGLQLGESLPIAWRAGFHCLFRPSLASWNSVKDFEAFRNQLRGLFYTVREAMDGARKTAEMLQSITGRQPGGMDRLLKAIEDAPQLQENVFRDWPSFSEPFQPADSVAVDASLAEALGITVDEARQKMDARRRELNAKPE